MESANIPVNNCEENAKATSDADNPECDRNSLKRKGDVEDTE